jgi:2-haloacid dehalogenase
MATRREVLGLFASSALAPGRSARSAKVKAVAFDLLTIFDPRSVEAVAKSIAPGRARELCETWRVRLFEYSWLRTAAGSYRDFHAITEDALGYASRVHGVTLSRDARQTLIGAYERLAPWPDAPSALQTMKSAGLRLAPLSNFTAATIETLLANAGLRPMFDGVISTDTARTFKPDPRAYALGPSALGLPREQIAFAAFGGWDAAGAKWFGYPTFWVNRLGLPAEELPPGPDAVGPTLSELAAWVGAH